MEYANALKFINSYNRIEAQLKLMYRTKPTQNFTDLVKRCSDQNLTVRRYAAELTDYGKLRNAIVHRTMRGDQFIANPCDEVVESIAAIEKQICTPPRVMDAFKVKRIVHVFADSSLAEAFAKFSEGRRKSLPVYRDGKLAGILNPYTLMGKLFESSQNGADIAAYLNDTRCGDILDETELGNYRFMGKDANIFEVFQAFEAKKHVNAVIITENGAFGEKVLNIITPTDFPILNSYIENYDTKLL